jgi:uncharacterized protein YndB with AHSA1/START domain
MFKIKVERIVKAPIDKVFEAISDHGNYAAFPMIDKSELLQEGAEENNGLGAFRSVKMGSFQVWERITAFERPVHMQYKIERAKPLKMNHYKGVIDFVDLGDDTTKVTWVSEGAMAIPLLGKLLDKNIQKQGTGVFHSMLKSIERR